MAKTRVRMFSIKSLAAFLGWHYSKAYRLVTNGTIASIESDRGPAMKNRRITRAEARRIKRKEESGEVL